MPPSMKYWDDWVDAEDMESMWGDPAVCAEWIAAGEKQGHKVHISRNSGGKPYVTQTEMRAMATIIINRHFNGKLDPVMICAIAEIESDRQPLAYRFEPKLKEASTGLMQMLQSTAEWLARDMGYKHYTVDWSSSMLYRPFVSVYFAAAFLKWLSTYKGEPRSEEFVIRSYNGGPKQANSKSTQKYWNKYLTAKQSILSLSSSSQNEPDVKQNPSSKVGNKDDVKASSRKKWIYWDEKVSAADMDRLWMQNEIKEEWLKSGESVGKVRFARDSDLRPYLTRIELKAVADLTLSRHFNGGRLNTGMLCAVAEICSKRLLYGQDYPNGILHVALPTAQWLHDTLGYKAYAVHSIEDMSRPFVSMYFAAAYMTWLSTFEGRQRNDQFIVRAYLVGPQHVNSEMAGPCWLKYLEALTHYPQQRERKSSCSIM